MGGVSTKIMMNIIQIVEIDVYIYGQSINHLLNRSLTCGYFFSSFRYYEV
jgi:hypothetical protein